MESQDTLFDVTPDGVELLQQIIEVAANSVCPDWEERPDIPEETQELIIQVAGAIVVEIVRQAEEGAAEQ